MEYKISQYNSKWLKKLSDKYVGKVIGKLEVKEIIGRSEIGKRCLVIVLCYCGKEFKSNIYDVLRGHTKSCGCLRKIISKNAQRNIKHGESNSANKTKRSIEYASWVNMRYGVFSKTDSNIKLRPKISNGKITICDRWIEKKKGYLNFLEDMGRRPGKGFKFARIDRNKDFCPENCRWEKKVKVIF